MVCLRPPPEAEVPQDERAEVEGRLGSQLGGAWELGSPQVEALPDEQAEWEVEVQLRSRLDGA